MKYQEITLTKHQKSALVGTILGDTYIGIDRKGKNARMNFAHCSEQAEYYMHKYDLFKEFGGTSRYVEKEDKRTHKVYKKYAYTSRTHPILTELQKKFYIDKVKIIPDNIADMFDEISLAYLFMDDGSHHKNGYYLSLCNFSTEDLNKFVEFLHKRFNLICTIHSQKNVYIQKESVEHFNELVKDYILPSMEYKLLDHSSRKTPLNGENLGNQATTVLNPQEIEENAERLEVMPNK